jgi:hypothetical protein
MMHIAKVQNNISVGFVAAVLPIGGLSDPVSW